MGRHRKRKIRYRAHVRRLDRVAYGHSVWWGITITKGKKVITQRASGDFHDAVTIASQLAQAFNRERY